jgi:hypothetical protein
MSAEAVGLHMPAVVTLADLAAMNSADPNGHRYETSPEWRKPPSPGVWLTVADLPLAWLLGTTPADHVR